MPIVDGRWSGPIPNPDEPGRKEFEQYLASQTTAQDYEQMRTSPNSVLSPTFNADLAANLQGQQELQRQGLTSVVGSPFENGAWRAGTKLDSPEQAVSAYLNALTIERPFGGSQITGEKDLETLFRSYINTALVDPNAAADTLARMRALGFDPHAPNQAGMIDALDPEFNSKIYYKYYDPNREDKKAVAPVQILYNRMAAGERNPWEAEVAPSPAPYRRTAPVIDEVDQTASLPGTPAPQTGLISGAVAPADPIRSTGYPEAPRDPAPAPLVTPNVGGKVITGTDVNVTDATTKTLKDEVEGKVTGTAAATPATITNVYDPTTSTLVTPATQTTPAAGVADGKVTMASPTLPANFGSLTRDQKATLYASMRQQGFTDADIRAAAGTQDEASWQALRRLAGYDVPTVATVKPGNTARVKQNNFGGLLATANDPLAAANMAALAGSQAPGIIGSARTNPFAPPPTTVRLPPGVTPWWPGNGG